MKVKLLQMDPFKLGHLSKSKLHENEEERDPTLIE